MWSLKDSVGKIVLSICGGRDVMFSRFLSLEEEEKHKNQDQEEDFRYGYNFAIGGNHARETDSYIHLGGGRWSMGEEIKCILYDDKKNISLSSSRKKIQEEPFLRSRVEYHESVDASCSGNLPKNVRVVMVVSRDAPKSSKYCRKCQGKILSLLLNSYFAPSMF